MQNKQFYKIKANKSLGQNFIISDEITDKIVSYSQNITSDSIIEIGPGLGILTKSILKNNPKKLISIEKDHRFTDIYTKLAKDYHGKYEFKIADALNINYKTLANPPIKIIANLPYNISTTLLLKLLNDINHFDSLTLMFQKEVADRILAQPNSKSYGTLSILVQLLCKVEKMEDLMPDAFYPSPKVHSSILHIIPFKTPKFKVDYHKVTKVVNATFNYRRKMIHTSLKHITNNVETILKLANINGDLRPDNMSIEQFCKIAYFI
ncbi:16S rRNA (adenine(1518)-N(6)/adenine(1519)-N(6))-dimethyltransferase RsmA [Neoehrlichia mikurensis]|uniref:16S rRNA (adenine(1518)-N(6)/adenine(1519)-N(6))- dimethyltransferase RsmA n=1 Tax=Neoehrlichia mikurensis TaxID=89586 RepID=UPI001C43931C|nr:16S rRNA (adenine(1518)-N(6)/adenine(1519)-N(6))-dimethyltransferase RsmA [Neoehrlichia mikurensis]QXK93144.1 16S rRNA (adenine(1518)-N(6)/adenine(1519)-N(6))-dimethyltransferase RsmA [Neoehrlichia mikurensis]QXK93624.1 16S rRNA (adenine(1518)-N(6)/adenine(1519)-N(6))-dimethyltransferase RsmA [Neoehrlichia mikurensis]